MSTIETTEAVKVPFHESLRAIADLMEAHPDLPLPRLGDEFATFHYWGNDPQILLDWTKNIGGSFAKNDPKKGSYDRDYYVLTGSKKLGGLTPKILAQRSAVCERVQTGTQKIVHARVAAVKAIPEYTEDRPVYSFDCVPLNKPKETVEFEAVIESFADGLVSA